eukprot:gene5247-6530_t
MNKIVPLLCVSQNYAWGNLGKTSTVAQLLPSCTEVKETTPYAELWMGSHPSGPSKVLIDTDKEVTLSEYIEMNGHSNILGQKSIDRFGKDFPFLFKVLSIRTALSIQSHPDSSLAQILHQKFPSIYKDPYHKPEIAIAITPFEALCGFRPLDEIIRFIKDVPELKSSLPENLTNNNCKEYLKQIVTSLLKQDQEIISKNLENLYQRLSSSPSKNELDRLVIKLYEQYPKDVGVFFAYILNYMVLNPGDALFLAAGEPHAYISGDCVECMAPSDNVVRAGLTPKFKDVDTLADMLTYSTGIPPLVKPLVSSDGSHFVYQPPVDEFQVELYTLKQTNQTTTVKSCQSPSIVLVLCGEVSIKNQTIQQDDKKLVNQERGTILFVPANTEYTITSNSNHQPSTIYIARLNEKLFHHQKL